MLSFSALWVTAALLSSLFRCAIKVNTRTSCRLKEGLSTDVVLGDVGVAAWELEVEFSVVWDGGGGAAAVDDDVDVVVVEVVVEVVCNFLCLRMIFPKSCDGLGKMLRSVSWMASGGCNNNFSPKVLQKSLAASICCWTEIYSHLF